MQTDAAAVDHGPVSGPGYPHAVLGNRLVKGAADQADAAAVDHGPVSIPGYPDAVLGDCFDLGLSGRADSAAVLQRTGSAHRAALVHAVLVHVRVGKHLGIHGNGAGVQERAIGGAGGIHAVLSDTGSAVGAHQGNGAGIAEHGIRGDAVNAHAISGRLGVRDEIDADQARVGHR